MNSTDTQFNPQELSSRKLLELVTNTRSEEITAGELQDAIEELATRRYHLSQLQKTSGPADKNHHR